MALVVNLKRDMLGIKFLLSDIGSRELIFLLMKVPSVLLGIPRYFCRRIDEDSVP